MNKTISVIIPVYNVVAYLPQCMDSVLSQSYEALEVILIDDGSTDGSGALCDVYEKKDSRVKVIHQKNGGAASAKNAGLRIATGEYLAFADSDDYLEPGAYLFMVSTLESYGADVVQSGYRNIFTNSQEDHIAQTTLCEYEATEYLRLYTNDWTCALLWDKLYKRSIFDGIFFAEGHIVDDEFFTYQGIMNAQKIVFVPNVIYNYRQRKSSVTAKPEYRARTVLDKLDYLQKRRKNVVARFPELAADYEKNFVNMLLWLSKDAYGTEESLRQIKQLVKEYLFSVKSCRHHWSAWYALLRIRTLSVSWLLKNKAPVPQTDHLSHYFD